MPTGLHIGDGVALFVRVETLLGVGSVTVMYHVSAITC